MPQAERYEPTGDLHIFDGGEDDDLPEEEGSRLALLLVLALFVLGAFGGVVYLAYSQGVKQGRDEAPRAVALSPVLPTTSPPLPSNKDFNVYKTPSTESDLANEDSAPPPPTVIPARPQTKTAGNSAKVVAPGTPAATSPPATSTQPAAKSSPTKTVVALPPSASAPPRTIPTARPTAKPAAQTHAGMPPPPKQTVATAEPGSLAAPPTSAVPAAGKPAPATNSEALAANPPSAAPLVLTPPPASAAPPAPAKSGGFVLQIGAYKSEAEAMASWRAYKSAHATVAAYEPDIRQVQLGGKGTWYRLRVGSFADSAEANSVCAKLKAEGASCFPAKR